jgi:hypothetical protein
VFGLLLLFFYTQEFQVTTKRFCIFPDTSEISLQDSHCFGNVTLLREHSISLHFHLLKFLGSFGERTAQVIDFKEMQVKLMSAVIVRC